MLQNILPITGPVMQTAQKPDKFRVQPVDAHFNNSLFSFFFDYALHFLAGLLHHLLNPGRVNPAVRNQPFQRQPGHFPPDWSNPERITASGVSSIIKSIPVRVSKARIFLPSRPIILPFISSLGNETTETVASATWSAAYLWMAVDKISLDFFSDSSFILA